ncbi:MAG: acyl-CoA dehydrogenase family protein [Acidimicrobiales bacterium]
MEFAFTDDQRQLAAAVRQVLERECTPADLRVLHDTTAPGGGDRAGSGERWRVLAELGATGLLAPEDAGGLGLDDVALVGVLEEAGRVALPEPLAETAGLVVPLLAGLLERPDRAGPVDGDRVERTLADVAGGVSVATVGGVDAGRRRPVVTTAGGVTPRVVATGLADVAVLVADGRDGVGPEVHLVDGTAAHTVATPSIDRSRRLGRWEWTPTPATRLSAGEEAVDLLAELADRGAVTAAAQLLGLADRMITMSAAYAVDRHQFGRPIGSFQAVKHLLADARVRLEFARPATYRAAESLARRRPGRSVDAAMAKSLASDAADIAARVALQVHGAIGYTFECDLHLFMKRAWALSASWGDAVTQRARVLAQVLAERRARAAGAG